MRPKSYKQAKLNRILDERKTRCTSPKYRRVCREFFKRFKDSQYMYGKVSTTNIDMMMKVSLHLKRDFGYIDIKPITCMATKDPNQIPFRVILWFNGCMTMEVGRSCVTSQDMMDQTTALMDSQNIAGKVSLIEDKYNWYECGSRCNIQDIQDILTSILCGYSDEQIAHIMTVIIWWSSVICKQGTVKFAGVDTCSLTDRCHYYNINSAFRSMMSAARYSFGTGQLASHIRRALSDPATITEYFGLVSSDSSDGSYTAASEMSAPVYNPADIIEND